MGKEAEESIGQFKMEDLINSVSPEKYDECPKESIHLDSDSEKPDNEDMDSNSKLKHSQCRIPREAKNSKGSRIALRSKLRDGSAVREAAEAAREEVGLPS